MRLENRYRLLTVLFCFALRTISVPVNNNQGKGIFFIHI